MMLDPARQPVKKREDSVKQVETISGPEACLTSISHYCTQSNPRIQVICQGRNENLNRTIALYWKKGWSLFNQME